MIFEGKIRELGSFDLDSILEKLPDISSDLWNLNSKRQKTWAVHSETCHIPIISIENYWDKPISEAKIHNEYPEELVTAVTNAAEKVRALFNGTITYATLIMLPAGKRIAQHKDAFPLNLIHRCHLPITTNPDCTFTVVNTDFRLIPGTVYELNNQLPHKVDNNGSTPRIHLLVDVLPNENS